MFCEGLELTPACCAGTVVSAAFANSITIYKGEC